MRRRSYEVPRSYQTQHGCERELSGLHIELWLRYIANAKEMWATCLSGLERHPPTFGERDTSHIMDIAHERSLAIVRGLESAIRQHCETHANSDFERLRIVQRRGAGSSSSS